LPAYTVVDYIMTPPHAVITLGVGTASMEIALIINLAIISLIEMLEIALTEKDRKKDKIEVE
jgi:hypothetical protein